jgi:hypothetical protein
MNKKLAPDFPSFVNLDAVTTSAHYTIQYPQQQHLKPA